MNTPLVTLTTDWGDCAFFSGMVKGALLRRVEGVQIIDITHGLTVYDIIPASFVVRHACLGFPEGTVHLIDVASQPPFIALRARGQYYLCSDNGLPAEVFGNEVEEAVSIPTQEGGIYNFAAYNLFVPAATRLLKRAPLSDIGPQYTQLTRRPRNTFMPNGENYTIYVHYIDDYGNLYLGMSYREFEELRKGRPFEIQVNEMVVKEISPSYQNSGNNEYGLVLTVSVTGQLELAMKNNNLARLQGVKCNERVLLKFKG